MKRKVYWHSPGYYWLILIGILVRAGLLIYIVVALFVRKRAIVSVHLCARHRMLYYYFRVGSWLAALLGLGLIIWGGNGPQMGLVGLGLLVIITAAIAGSRGARLLRAARIQDNVVQLKGAGPRFLESLPPWNS